MSYSVIQWIEIPLWIIRATDVMSEQQDTHANPQ